MHFIFIGILAAGLTGCAGTVKPGENMAADLYTLKQQFADGRYQESLQGCLLLIDGRPACAALDQALYYAALNSLRLGPGQGGGRAAAAGYFRRLLADCPGSPYQPEAELWIEALAASAGGAMPGAEQNGGPDSLAKKDQEIKRLRGEVQRLNREIDQLKDVDVQLHRQKKDLDDGPDKRKNSRP